MEFNSSIRPRRLRRGQNIRNFAVDVRLHPDDFVMPVFVRSGSGIKKAIGSMPGIFQMSPDVALNYVSSLTANGIKHFIFFGVIESSEKDEIGSAAFSDSCPVNVAMREIKSKGVEALLIADLCFCEYTSHGHCGLLKMNKSGQVDETETIDNDRSAERIAELAVVLAKNGADVLAPSGMLDGMVSAVRHQLDENNFSQTPILSYAIKFASSMYGPFRDAGEGAPRFGDRRGYQMDFRRSGEWRLEADLDLAEGADMLMVKPALPYLDILTRLTEFSSVPVGAYHVSGEFSMLHAAAANNWLDLKSSALEHMYALKRAGAQFIITYFAEKMPEWL